MYRDLRKELIIDYKHRCLRGQSAMTRLILMFLFILGFLTGKPLLLLGEKPEIVYAPKKEKGLLDILFGDILDGSSLGNLLMFPVPEYKLPYKIK